MSSASSSVEVEEGQQHATGVTMGGNVLGSPLQIYLMQICVIMGLSQILGYVFRYIRQPQVVAEVIAGIILGPTFLSAIPAFQEALFPEDSLEALRLTAELGLVLFLFVVGLEINPSLLRENLKKSMCLSLSGQALTWLISIPVALLLHSSLQDDGTEFGTFYLFIGTAMGVTAMVVLSRILAEERLMETKVGVAVLGAAAFDDLTAWTLLVLSISIIGATSESSGGEDGGGGGGVADAAYVFLLALGYAAFVITLGRRLLLSVIRFMDPLCLTGAPPNQGTVAMTLFLTLLSAWCTECIGVSSIFGAFLVGLVVPRSDEDCFASTLAEKVEDVVAAVLLPLYFAVSGLRTDFRELDSPSKWGYAAVVILGACSGKIGGAGLAARSQGMDWRTSLACGLLMNTRGLVELIILNAGLNAGIINETVFAIMVLMAVVTTFMASPCVRYIYPPELREVSLSEESGGGVAPAGEDLFKGGLSKQRYCFQQNLSMIVDSTEELRKSLRILACVPDMRLQPYSMSSLTRVICLLAPPGSADLQAARLLWLGDRFSSDIRVASQRSTLMRDDTMAQFRREMGKDAQIKAHMVLMGSGRDEAVASQDVLRIAMKNCSSAILIPLTVVEARALETGSGGGGGTDKMTRTAKVKLNENGARLARLVIESPNRQAVTAVFLGSTSNPGFDCYPSNAPDASGRGGITVPYVGDADSKNALTLALIMSLNSGQVSGAGLIIYVLSRPPSPASTVRPPSPGHQRRGSGIEGFSYYGNTEDSRRDPPPQQLHQQRHPSIMGRESLMARFDTLPSDGQSRSFEEGAVDEEECKETETREARRDASVVGETMNSATAVSIALERKSLAVSHSDDDIGGEDLVCTAERLGATIIRITQQSDEAEAAAEAHEEFMMRVIEACKGSEGGQVVCGRGAVSKRGDVLGSIGSTILAYAPTSNLVVVSAPHAPPLPARTRQISSPDEVSQV